MDICVHEKVRKMSLLSAYLGKEGNEITSKNRLIFNVISLPVYL